MTEREEWAMNGRGINPNPFGTRQTELLTQEDLQAERQEAIDIFVEMIRAVLEDGSGKRAAGEKPSWKVDKAHHAAIFSHLSKYAHGERVDPDSGQSPYVHLAVRALMIAYQDRAFQQMLDQAVAQARRKSVWRD